MRSYVGYFESIHRRLPQVLVFYEERVVLCRELLIYRLKPFESGLLFLKRRSQLNHHRTLALELPALGELVQRLTKAIGQDGGGQPFALGQLRC